MAKKSNSSARALAPALGVWIACLLATIVVVGSGMSLMACPFCTALKPSLSQLRERAAVVALAEVQRPIDAKRSHLRLHRVLEGASRLSQTDSLDVPLDLAAKPGSLIILFGTPDGTPSGPLSWHAVAVNEAGYAYFARSPKANATAAERLRYFAPFLENLDPLIADDAYLEFGHAPFDEVARAADVLSMPRVRGWLTSDKVPPERKGFYGLALGLCTQADECAANAEYLRGLVVAPEDDFRAGFDGVLGGYLLLAGRAGLELVEARYLANLRAADGDVRHAVTALRFYYEYGHEISKDRLKLALRHLLDRPEFAAGAITDLARWKDWDALDRVAALYTREGFGQPAIGRAIVGYLVACPNPDAAAALERLRQADPKGVQAAQRALAVTVDGPRRE